MRRFLLIAPLLLVGCTLEQQNGSLRAIPGPLFVEPEWQITQQDANGAERTCRVASADLEVIQWTNGRRSATQVATSYSLAPGDAYKVLVGNQVFETMEQRFTPSQSRDIVAALMQADSIYTEKRILTMGGRTTFQRSDDSKLSMAGFAAQYKACVRFVGGK